VLYLVGGVATLISLRIVGRVVDRFGSTPVVVFGACGSAAVVLLLTWGAPPTSALPAVFATFMVTQSARNVAQQALTSKVPSPTERAGFQSLQSSVQHGALAAGAFLGSFLLGEVDGKLTGLPLLGAVAVVVAATGLPLAAWLERRLRARLTTTATTATAAATQAPASSMT
jgi:predicted MFS family arabinose efflux permease